MKGINNNTASHVLTPRSVIQKNSLFAGYNFLKRAFTFNKLLLSNFAEFFEDNRSKFGRRTLKNGLQN